MGRVYCASEMAKCFGLHRNQEQQRVGGNLPPTRGGLEKCGLLILIGGKSRERHRENRFKSVTYYTSDLAGNRKIEGSAHCNNYMFLESQNFTARRVNGLNVSNRGRPFELLAVRAFCVACRGREDRFRYNYYPKDRSYV